MAQQGSLLVPLIHHLAGKMVQPNTTPTHKRKPWYFGTQKELIINNSEQQVLTWTIPDSLSLSLSRSLSVSLCLSEEGGWFQELRLWRPAEASFAPGGSTFT